MIRRILYRLAANITEYHIVSKLNYLRIGKFYRKDEYHDRVTTLSTFYLTLSGKLILSLKLIGQF